MTMTTWIGIVLCLSRSAILSGLNLGLFSRHALRLGDEQIRYPRERDLRRVIELHMEATERDIERVEGLGARNFLDIDDVPLDGEAEAVP
jgi:hypothetical protein